MEIGVVVMKPIAWPYYGIPFTCFGPLENEAVRCIPVQNSRRWILDSEEVSTVVPGMNSHEE
jgi:predicted aldo/keto reductase-like oxidoreductase